MVDGPEGRNRLGSGWQLQSRQELFCIMPAGLLSPALFQVVYDLAREPVKRAEPGPRYIGELPPRTERRRRGQSVRAPTADLVTGEVLGASLQSHRGQLLH